MERRTESKASIRRRVAECWGFYCPAVELLELGFKDGWCDHAAFRVNGVGYSTDFRSLSMDPALDADEPER